MSPWSLVIAFVMAELTLHPMRLPLPDRARIAAMYAPNGADLQPVVIQSTDGGTLHAWYSVPEHQLPYETLVQAASVVCDL